MATTPVTLPRVSRKFIKKAQQLEMPKSHLVGYYEEFIGEIAYPLSTLAHKKKKLSAAEKALLQNIRQLLPHMLQLFDDCLDWGSRKVYFEHVKKAMSQQKRKALKGDVEALNEYNRLVREWGKYEPGKFVRI